MQGSKQMIGAAVLLLRTRLESPDGETRLILNPQPDGLYAPHTEILTLRLVNGQWKIDELKWEPAS